jgi:hypothetical protein
MFNIGSAGRQVVLFGISWHLLYRTLSRYGDTLKRSFTVFSWNTTSSEHSFSLAYALDVRE